MATDPTQAVRRRKGKLYAALLVLLAIAFGGVVLWKSVYLNRPQGDFGCFARAGWAVRQGGESLYRVEDDNGWHFNYPPTFALLMSPLADPPRVKWQTLAATVVGAAGSSTPTAGLGTVAVLLASPVPLRGEGVYLPYPVSVFLFYLINVCMLWLAIHWLVRAIEKRVPPASDPAESWRRWWRWRIVPAVVCIAPIGLTLVRSQVQILLLLLVCGMIIGLLENRHWLAGACIGLAVCLKIFPAFLVIALLVRRDLRGLAGCALALVVGLIVLPVIVIGPLPTVDLYREYAQVTVLPGLGLGADASRAKELIDATATQSQSFQVILHKTLHLGSTIIPPKPEPWVKLVHWGIGGAMTLALLVGRDSLLRASGMALFARLGLLGLLMVLVCPVCHLHYLILALPIVLALLVRLDVERPGRNHLGLGLLSLFFLGAVNIPMIPGLGILRNIGLPMWGALAFWAMGYCSQWNTADRAAALADQDGAETALPRVQMSRAA